LRRNKRFRVNRRQVLAGLGGLALAPMAGPVFAEALLDASTLGVVPGGDQTAALKDALSQAAATGRPLFLPGGNYSVTDLTIPDGVTLVGVQGQTWLIGSGAGPVARVSDSSDVVIEAISFGPGEGGSGSGGGLLEIETSTHISVTRCRFISSSGSGITSYASSGSIDHCDFDGHRGAAIFSRDGNGLVITNNSITGCGDGGILIWGSAPRHQDGSIVIGNTISRIDARSGGNGQNGNGINVFQADRVIIADNQIADCAFTAIRLNGTNNTQVRGNTCINSGEVAIFSEFAFSGSVIADNIIDGAAQGISITNFDHGGRLATCSGNIVRNIAERSLVNPDTRPVGIYAEADTAVTGNVVENVPGIAIAAGYGTFLKNVVIADNVVNAAHIGIGVSVVENPSPGPVKISDNMIFDPLDYGIVGLHWDEVASDDLVRDAERYPHVSIEGNTIGRLS